MDKICLHCGKKIGFFTPTILIKDGYICSNCLKELGIKRPTNLDESIKYKTFSLNKLIEISNEKKLMQNKISSFVATQKVGKYLGINENDKTFTVNTGKEIMLFNFNELLDFELQEDGETISKGGLGRAVAGGILMGGVGAIVGGVTGKKKSKSVCTSLKIMLKLKSDYNNLLYINFINAEHKKTSFVYKTFLQQAQECMVLLEIINRENASNSTVNKNNNSISEADEIMKFKQLMNEGIITEEEFNKKKKQILNID